MSLAYFLDVLRRRWWIIVLGALLASALYVFFASRTTQAIAYKAEAGLFILPTAVRVELEPQLKTIDSGLPKDVNSKVDRRQALLALVKSPIIAQHVFEQLKDELPPGFTQPSALLPYIEGSVGGEVLLIQATFGDAELAANIANAWAEAYETEANAIFGGTTTPANLDAEVEAARRAYEEAEARYVQALATSPLLELQRRLEDRTVLLEQILADRLNRLDAFRLRAAELERLSVDAKALQRRLRNIDEPDLSIYLAYLLLQNRVLVQDGLIFFNGVEESDSRVAFDQRLSTSLTLEPDQLAPLIAKTSIDELAAQVDEIIYLLESKKADIEQTLAEGEGRSDAPSERQQIIDNLEAEIRSLQSQVEAENARLNQLQLEKEAAQNTYKVLLNKLEEVRIAASVGEGSIVRFAFPAVPEAKKNAVTSQVTMIGLLLATLLGILTSVGVVIALEFVDDKVRTSEQLARGLESLSLGALPRSAPVVENSPVALAAPLSPFAEGARYLRTRLRSHYPELRSLLITSVSPREGKTSVAVNLAALLAAGGQRVILVDANLRSPSVHDLFALPNRSGLSTWLESDMEAAESFLHDTPLPGLRIFPAGPSTDQPSELLDSGRMDELLRRLQQMADIVLIDSPHIAGLADGLVISRKVEGTLLVIRSGYENIRQVQSVLEQVEDVGGRIIGVVLNAAPDATHVRLGHSREPDQADAASNSQTTGWTGRWRERFVR
ncbi:MAG: polysaccharide biosynthesis tyrosine autokinase [Chloroflexi bacterium]|nr:polysaccharide biosynthesis tyrosine autokinase [Chloroflexota bacterium]